MPGFKFADVPELNDIATRDLNSFRRGAWYAAVELETLIAEVAFHQKRFLGDARIFSQGSSACMDFLADMSAQFHCLEASEIKTCLQPEPIPQCYAASQALANFLLYSGSNGIVYQSVRRVDGTCTACFRPALVYDVRSDKEYRITLEAGSEALSIEASARS